MEVTEDRRRRLRAKRVNASGLPSWHPRGSDTRQISSVMRIQIPFNRDLSPGGIVKELDFFQEASSDHAQLYSFSEAFEGAKQGKGRKRSKNKGPKRNLAGRPLIGIRFAYRGRQMRGNFSH